MMNSSSNRNTNFFLKIKTIFIYYAYGSVKCVQLAFGGLFPPRFRARALSLSVMPGNDIDDAQEISCVH